MVSSVSIRLGTTGKADVQADFAAIADSGDASAKRLTASYQRAGQDIEAATKRQADAAGKIAAIMPTSTQATVNASVGTGYSGSQNANAAQFSALLAEQERQVEAVKAAIDPMYRAQKQYDEELATAAGLLSRSAISEREYAAAVQLSADALQRARQAQAAKSVSTVPDNNAHVLAFKQANDDDAAAAERLRAAIDPLYTAQKRFDAEIATADGLLQRNRISEDEHAVAVKQSSDALAKAKRDVEDHSTALGLNRAQFITAQSAVLRFTDSIIAGQSPIRAFALEAHKGAEVLAMDDGGLAGGLAKVSAFINPVTIGIAAVTAVLLAGTASWVSYIDAVSKLESVARVAGATIGVTGEQLEANAEAVSRNGQLTVGAARDIEAGFVQAGGIGANVLKGLTQLTADFAASTGTDAKSAGQDLAKIFQDPAKGAEELASKYGLLDQKQVEQIRQLVDMGDLYGAQARLLSDLGPAFDGAARHAEGFKAAFDDIKASISGAWAEFGRFITGVGNVTPAMKQLIDLQQQRAMLVAGNGNGTDTSALDKQIADLKAQVGQERDKANAAPSNALAQKAVGAGSDFTGHDQIEALKAKQGELRRALANPGAVGELQQTGQLEGTRQALEAYTHAIDTFLPTAEKKRQLDLADVEIAKARASRNPAALASASAHREQIEQAGQVVTKADADADAMAKGERARARLDGAIDKHTATLAREAAAMDANTRAAMDAAKAYLTGGAPAGEEAEARRKAVTDATKKGTTVDDAVRRQIANSGADSELAGAKAISSLLQETSARAAVNDQVDKGVISIDDMSRALGDEQALRALTVTQTLAQKKGLTELYSAITAEIEKYKGALQEAHAEEANTGTNKALDDVQKRLEDARLVKQYSGDTTGGYDRAKAALDARRSADADGETDPGRREARVTGAVDANAEAQRGQNAQSAANAIRASNDNLAITQAQLGMVGKSADAQQLVIDKLKLQQSLAIGLKGNYAEFAPAILAAASAADVSAEHLKQAQATMSELQSAGDKFIDDLTNPKGDGIKNLLKDIEQEMLKLAAIDPLKNLLLGENTPTLGGLASLKGGASGGGGLGSILGKLGGFLGLGGGNKIDVAGNEAGANSAIASILGSLHGFASGTESAAAGPAWVGEQGPELVNLPQGAKVTNAADTRRLMTAANDPSHIKVSIETNDAMFSAKVSSISGAHVEAAAPGIRSGAVSDVKEHYARQGRYGLGQR